MAIGPLTVETHPRQEDVQFLEDRLHDYNEAQTGITDGHLTWEQNRLSPTFWTV